MFVLGNGRVEMVFGSGNSGNSGNDGIKGNWLSVKNEYF